MNWLLLSAAAVAIGAVFVAMRSTSNRERHAQRKRNGGAG